MSGMVSGFSLLQNRVSQDGLGHLPGGQNLRHDFRPFWINGFLNRDNKSFRLTIPQYPEPLSPAQPVQNLSRLLMQRFRRYIRHHGIKRHQNRVTLKPSPPPSASWSKGQFDNAGFHCFRAARDDPILHQFRPRQSVAFLRQRGAAGRGVEFMHGIVFRRI